MPQQRANPDRSKFNANLELPFNLRQADFEAAMQDVYDFFYDVNQFLLDRGLSRLDDMLRKANLSGLLSDMLTESLARHSRSLTENQFHNGHPDLIVRGTYPNNSVQSGTEGVEIKSTLKAGGAVDAHAARDQWLAVFVYSVDNDTEPATDRKPLQFREIYVGQVAESDYRRNDRGVRGTRTATLGRVGVQRFRESWLYKNPEETSR